MAGRSEAEREALEGLSERILDVFRAEGYRHIQPDILQPADIFLDRSGEDIRTRTYVFMDPEGRELCLRPDLTVPTCRFHLTHAGDESDEARYCYAGPAFRYQPQAAEAQRPGEFHQVGFEWIAPKDRERSEAQVLAVTLEAIYRAGLQDYRVRLGDLGLFRALLQCIEMPERWRRRLAHQFWRPRAFRALLRQLGGEQATQRTSLSPLIDRLAAGEDTLELVERTLDEHGLMLVAGRTSEEIAERLQEKARDRTEMRLSRDDIALIDDYLAVRGSPQRVLDELKAIGGRAGEGMLAPVMAYASRLKEMEKAGIAPEAMEFAAVFGRSLEYYTGFVFQVETTAPDGTAVSLAGGGRYDDLLADIGAQASIPALGCAIHLDRVLAFSGRDVDYA